MCIKQKWPKVEKSNMYHVDCVYVFLYPSKAILISYTMSCSNKFWRIKYLLLSIK